MDTEVWQRGPVPGYEPLLMPVVHSLLQVREDVDRLLASVREDQVWTRPYGAASTGFHLRHLAGSTRRLLTYARGERLTDAQLAAAAREADEQLSLDGLREELDAVLDEALAQLRATPANQLLSDRKIGRAQLPTTTIGLLFHAAEHATRHMGQAITTARIIRGLAG
jgi:uncharacterized damage-inducible protein DinB